MAMIPGALRLSAAVAVAALALGGTPSGPGQHSAAVGASTAVSVLSPAPAPPVEIVAATGSDGSGPADEQAPGTASFERAPAGAGASPARRLTAAGAPQPKPSTPAKPTPGRRLTIPAPPPAGPPSPEIAAGAQPLEAAMRVCRAVVLRTRHTDAGTQPARTVPAATRVTGHRVGPWFVPTSGPLAGWGLPASALCPESDYAPGTDVHHADHRQVMVATQTGNGGGTYQGTWVRWEWRDATASWEPVGDQRVVVQFGRNGVQDGRTRVQGSGTTPAGTYRIPFAFGAGPPPGTRIGYRTVDRCSWWLGRDGLATGYYNRWKQDCTRRYTDAEYLPTYVATGQYVQAAVIGFNYDDPRIAYGPGSGSAIFLHYNDLGKPTAGCVALTDLAELTATIAWLDPARSPVIVIR